MKKVPVSLYFVTAEDRAAGRMVFATSVDSAIARFGPEVSSDIATVKSRLIVSDVKLLRVIWSGFLPRPANVVDLRELGFQVSQSATGQRVSRLGDQVFVDAFSLHDGVMAGHEREQINAEDADYGRNV